MMASQTSPTAAMHPHHVVQQGRGQPNGLVALQPPQQAKPASHFLQQANEGIWLQLGTFRVFVFTSSMTRLLTRPRKCFRVDG